MLKSFESLSSESESGRRLSRRERRLMNKQRRTNNNFDDDILNKYDNSINKVIDKPKRPDNYKEPSYKMDGSVKQLFLNLTKMQIPFNKEDTLEEFFPKGMKKDEHGNYFIKIGDSKTMFCGHLDTYCRVYERVYHIIEGDIIMTDGTTTLGGDDKAGIVVMIKMIEAGVPGLYYFFRGEEGVTSPTGTWGSKQALVTYRDMFKDYERCVAFDRRGFESIISQQTYSQCCSEEFVKALVEEFQKNGMTYRDDKTGMWCDSGVFMELIPECTNISVGYQKEHTFQESQDIEHLENLVKACLKIDWDNLPVKRDPTKVTKTFGRYRYGSDYDWDDFVGHGSNYDYGNYGNYGTNYNRNRGVTSSLPTTTSSSPPSLKTIFTNLSKVLDGLNYECINPESYNEEGEALYFQNKKHDEFFAIKIISGDIYMTDDKELLNYTNYGSFDTFKKYVLSGDPDETDEPNDEKLKIYDSIITTYPLLIMEIIEDLSKNISTVVSSDNWLELDDIMTNKLKLQMDYSGTSGYNPDDFVDWIRDNKTKVTNFIKSLKLVNQTDKSKFLNNIEPTDYYTDLQDETFSKIVENEKELMRLILLDIKIMRNTKVRSTTLKNIKEILPKYVDFKYIKPGQKNINESEFILWVFDYTDEIEEFLKNKGGDI